MSIGYIEYRILSDNYARLYKYITEKKLPSRNITERNAYLYLRLSIEYCADLEAFLEKNHYEYAVLNKKGAVFTARKIFNRMGIVIGGVIALAAALVCSNMIFKIEILSDDEQVQEEILTVLNQNGVHAGTFMPAVNCVEVERELKQTVSGISWAGLSTDGTTLIIDVVENIDKPQQRRDRMPSNLVSKYDAIVDKIELYDGQLKTTIGSGVKKGDILVSGTVITDKLYYKDTKEMHDITTRYARSQGKIYGTFNVTKTFTQPFEQSVQYVDEKQISRKYLGIFDMKIPLFFGKAEGKYIETSKTDDLYLFGLKLPVSITSCSLNEYSYKTVSLSKEEASEQANELVNKYEHNFLKEYEIKKASRNEKITDDGIEITVQYTLYGVISEELEFFAPK